MYTKPHTLNIVKPKRRTVPQGTFRFVKRKRIAFDYKYTCWVIMRINKKGRWKDYGSWRFDNEFATKKKAKEFLLDYHNRGKVSRKI